MASSRSWSRRCARHPRTPSANLEELIEADAAELARVAEEARPGARRFIRPATSSSPRGRSTQLEDGILVRDGGATVIFQWDLLAVQAARDVIWNQNFGHLGTGSPYAVGASVAEGGNNRSCC